MNRQEVFNRVAKHLLTQMKKTTRFCKKAQKIRAAYRNGDGESSAVGYLMTGKAYHNSLELHAVSDECVLNALRKSGIELDTYDEVLMLKQLESIHNAGQTEKWQERIEAVAKAHGLTFPEGV